MTARLPLLKRPLDTLITAYLFFHIPITLLFATQVVLGPDCTWIPNWASDLLASAAESSADPLLSMGLPGVKREPWMIAIFYQEVFIQLPLFVILGRGLIQGMVRVSQKDAQSWGFHVGCLIYSVQSLTAMASVLVELVDRTGTDLVGSYLIFAIMPILILWRTLRSDTFRQSKLNPKRKPN